MGLRLFVALLAAALLAPVASGCARSGSPTHGARTTITGPFVTTGPGPAVSIPPTTTSTPPPSGAPSGGALLRSGDSGPAVLQLEQRLTSLGYWLGSADGDFGTLTEQAVMALQKTAGIDPDGVVGPLTDDALARGTRPTARSSSGHVVEIDLEHQVVALVTDGRVDTVFNTSTGTGQPYVSQGTIELAVTPRGQFTVFRQVDGSDVSPLGVLWRPKYFAGGVAIHGYADVPAVPASHGCVRVSIAAMDWIWTAGPVPLGTPVWVY